MPITEKSSVSEIRRQAEHLRDMLEEPLDFQQMTDTREAVYELRGVIHMKLSEIARTRKELADAVEIAKRGEATSLLEPEDVPELERERRQWLNVQEELIAVLSDYL